MASIRKSLSKKLNILVLSAKPIFTVFLFLAVEGHALTNSTPEFSADFSSVVMIETQAVDNDGSVIANTCVATILSPRQIVTAAHCVQDAFLLQKKEMKIFFGNYRWNHSSQGKPMRLGYIFSDPELITIQDYSFPYLQKTEIIEKGLGFRITPKDDLVLLSLNAELPLAQHNVKPAQLATREEWDKARHENLEKGLKVVSVNVLATISTMDTRRSATFTALSFGFLFDRSFIRSYDSSKLEESDSGSPAFYSIDGKLKIVAVANGEVQFLLRSSNVLTPIWQD